MNGSILEANKKCVLRLRSSHMRSVLDHGSIVYATANQYTQKQLDTVQKQAASR